MKRLITSIIAVVLILISVCIVPIPKAKAEECQSIRFLLLSSEDLEEYDENNTQEQIKGHPEKTKSRLFTYSLYNGNTFVGYAYVTVTGIYSVPDHMSEMTGISVSFSTGPYYFSLSYSVNLYLYMGSLGIFQSADLRAIAQYEITYNGVINQTQFIQYT